MDPTCLVYNAVGPFAMVEESICGRLLRLFMQRHGLADRDTFSEEVLATYHGVTEDNAYSSRLDYIILPACKVAGAQCRTDEHAAREVQKILDSRMRDHVLVRAVLEIRLTYTDQHVSPDAFRWDQHALIDGRNHKMTACV